MSGGKKHLRHLTKKVLLHIFFFEQEASTAGAGGRERIHMCIVAIADEQSLIR
jgi:hypothetical protein